MTIDGPMLPGDHGLRWSARVVDSEDRVVWEHTADQVLRTASIGKLLLLLHIDELMDTGELSPTQPVAKPSLIVRDSGLWHTMTDGALPLVDLAVLVGAVSDNLATNALIHLVGLESVDALRVRLGLKETRLLDEIRRGRGPDDPLTLSVGRADELCTVMRHIATQRSPRVRTWLADGVDLSMVASAFDLDPLAHRPSDKPPYLLVHKTGTDDGIRADVGWVSRGQVAVDAGSEGRSYRYAVLSQWDPNGPDRTRDVLEAMRDVGRWVRALLDATGAG